MNLNPKTQAAGISGAIMVVILFVLGQFGINVPADVAAAATTIVAFAAAYIKSSHDWSPR